MKRLGLALLGLLLFLAPAAAFDTRVVSDCTAPFSWSANDLGRPIPLGTNGLPCGSAGNASEAHIGEVGGNIIPITPTVTTTATTIASGESIGGKLTLTNAVRVSAALGQPGTSGIIQDIVFASTDVLLAGPLDVYFFNADPSASTCTNDTAFSLNTADTAKVIGVAHVTDFTRDQAASGSFVAQAGNWAKSFAVASGTSIFACIVWRGANYTSAASSSTFKVNILRN